MSEENSALHCHLLSPADIISQRWPAAGASWPQLCSAYFIRNSVCSELALTLPAQWLTASLRVTKINEEEYRCNCCVIFWSGPCCAVLTKQSVSLLTTALLSDWPAQAGTNQYSRLSDFMILCQAFLSCAASGCLSTEHIIVARFYIRFPPNKVISAEWQRGKFCCKWECWLDTIVGVSGCFLSGCTFTTSPDPATPFSMTISAVMSTSTSQSVSNNQSTLLSSVFFPQYQSVGLTWSEDDLTLGMSYWREPSGWAPLSQIGGEKYDLTPHSQLSTPLELCI